MIKIIKGVYGRRDGKIITPVTEADGPFCLDADKEKRLVDLGVAVYVNEDEAAPEAAEKVTEEAPEETAGDDSVEESPEYSESMKLAELKEIAEKYGVDASGMKSKKEVIEAIEEARAELPGFDAADSVQ